jgi:hypothetical protein
LMNYLIEETRAFDLLGDVAQALVIYTLLGVTLGVVGALTLPLRFPIFMWGWLWRTTLGHAVGWVTLYSLIEVYNVDFWDTYGDYFDTLMSDITLILLLTAPLLLLQATYLSKIQRVYRGYGTEPHNLRTWLGSARWEWWIPNGLFAIGTRLFFIDSGVGVTVMLLVYVAALAVTVKFIFRLE